MSSPKPTAKPAANELGVLLRHWRDLRGKSQFDLSLDTGVSQRHISFIESGRSAPGRQTLLEIAQALDIPLRDRNTLLLAAGYAPIYSEGAWKRPEMQSVNGRAGAHAAPARAFPGGGDGSLLGRAHDQRGSTALLQLLHRHGGAQDAAQPVCI